MTNVRLHVLTDGGTFDLETRRADGAAARSPRRALNARIDSRVHGRQHVAG